MDRSSKLVLVLIATGLWANALVPLMQPAHAQQAEWLSRIALDVQTIAHDIDALVKGGLNCTNQKFCN